MHPPFIFTDHRIGPAEHLPQRPPRRRSSPEPLDLVQAEDARQFARAPLVAERHAPPPGPRLVLVPPPRPGLRDLIGRFLIRTGQRILLTNRPG